MGDNIDAAGDALDVIGYVHRADALPPGPTTTTSTINSGGPFYWDMANGSRIVGNSPTERYEASLRIRGTKFVLAYCDIKPAWYSKLFARLLGLEWYEEMVIDPPEIFYGTYPILQWTDCIAGEAFREGLLWHQNEPVGMTPIDERPFNTRAEQTAHDPAWDADVYLDVLQRTV